MGRGKTLDPESGIDRHHAILDRGVQADDQGAERVVDRLGGDLAGFDLLGLLRHPPGGQARYRACRVEPPRTPATDAYGRRRRMPSMRSAQGMACVDEASRSTNFR